jgi:anti-sigma regulatory factor (Ser/Thr protein kinase)
MLARFMVDDRPDPQQFDAVIGGIVDEACRSGRTVRAFGEMVAVLWDTDNVTGAIELEALWNELRERHRFALCCAYPVSSLVDRDDLVAAGLVCGHHSEVIGSGSYVDAVPSLVPVDGARVARLFVPVPHAVRAVREFVAETLHAWSQADRIDDAVIVASELATNSVRHANSPFRFCLQRHADGVRMEIHDVSDVLPTPRNPTRHDVGGRGLAIIDGLSTSWGTELRADGKVVWSEILRPAS